MELIAETDERGEVVCVWRRRSTERCARPVRRGKSLISEIDTALVFGASRMQLQAWASLHQLRTPAPSARRPG